MRPISIRQRTPSLSISGELRGNIQRSIERFLRESARNIEELLREAAAPVRLRIVRPSGGDKTVV